MLADNRQITLVLVSYVTGLSVFVIYTGSMCQIRNVHFVIHSYTHLYHTAPESV